MIIAKTVKGKGVPFLENENGWHGKALNEDDFGKAIDALGEVDRDVRGHVAPPDDEQPNLQDPGTTEPPEYSRGRHEFPRGTPMATR